MWLCMPGAVRVRVCGCVAVWLCGCVAVWLCGYGYGYGCGAVYVAQGSLGGCCVPVILASIGIVIHISRVLQRQRKLV